MNESPVLVMRSLPDPWPREPFWHETLLRVAGRPRLLPLDHAPDWEGTPAGFVFHMMRCGSTLLGRMLQATGRVCVLSEPMAFQQLLTREPADQEQRRLWLRKLLGLYARPLAPAGQPVVVKWTSLCTRFIQEIQDAFPNVPCVFVYREPVEVLLSCQEGRPGGWWRVRPQDYAPSLRPPDGCEKFLERMARYLGSVCLFAAQAGALDLLHYPEIVTRAPQVARDFRLELSASENEKMLESASFYSKDRESRTLFDARAERQRRIPSPALIEAAEHFVRPALNFLLQEKSSR